MSEQETSANLESRESCPECGAAVPLVGERWLGVHRAGSPEYAYPRGDRRRCPGSLLAIGLRGTGIDEPPSGRPEPAT